MSIQLAIVILYIILLFAISMYVKHRASQNPTEYLFAGRKFSTGLVAVSITGMAVGAASTVGVAESAVKSAGSRLVQCRLGHWGHRHGFRRCRQIPVLELYDHSRTL